MGDISCIEYDGIKGSEPQGLTSERWLKEEKSEKETKKEQPDWQKENSDLGETWRIETIWQRQIPQRH